MDALFFLRHSNSNDIEIRYSLRAIHRHMSWVRKVWIFGDRPEFLSDDRSLVQHVPHEYVARTGSWRTPVTNFFLMTYLSSLIPDLAFEYLRFSDDFILLDDLTPEVARQDRCLEEDMSKVKNRGKGLWKESLWRTYDLLKRLGYPCYNFETHVPAFYTKKRVLEAYCDFKDFVTEDRWQGILGPTAILNHALSRGNFRLTPIGDTRAGCHGRHFSYEEVVKRCEGKKFFNFDDEGFGPGVKQFLAERFPEPSPYEKSVKTSVAVPANLMPAGTNGEKEGTTGASSTQPREQSPSPPAPHPQGERGESRVYPQVVMPNREAIADLLNRKELLGEAVEVGTLRGVFANSLLRRWHGRCLHCVDPWREVIEDNANGDKNNVRQKQHDINYAETQRLLTSYGSRCRLHRMTSSEAVTQFTDGSLDFVYLDARYRRVDLLEDLNLWLPKLREDGVLAGNAYLDGILPAGHFEVKSTVDAWAKEHGFDIVCTGEPLWRSWLIRVLRHQPKQETVV